MTDPGATVPTSAAASVADGLAGVVHALRSDPLSALLPLMQSLGLPVQTPADVVNVGVLLGLALMALVVLALQLVPSDPTATAMRRLRAQSAQHGHEQGRRSAAELAKSMPVPATGGLPLGYAPPAPWRPWRRRRAWRAIGLPWNVSRGHLLVAGPTTSGKSFHATDTLLRFPGPAIVVDPKEELWQRTAGTRASQYGPVYRIPTAGVDLAACFDLDQDLDRRELFECLLRPWQDGPQGRIFTDRTYPLLEAAVLVGKATNAHPLRLLARWARMAPGAALTEAEPHAPSQVAVLTDGTPLDKLTDNRFFLSSWGTFTTKLSPLAGQIHTLAMRPEDGGVPERWADARSTIYLTYPLHAQGAVGPLAAALIAGLLRHLQAAPPPSRTLLALDEAPAVGLPNLATYLATVGGAGAGVTCCVYVQNLSQLEAVYGRPGMEAIVSNAHFQVFFPARDTATARYLSDLFGEELEPVHSASGGTNTGAGRSAGRGGTRSFTTSQSASWNVTTRYRRFLTDAQAMALAPGTVAVFAAGFRALLTDSRTVLGPRMAQLPPPPAARAPAPAMGAHSAPEPTPADPVPAPAAVPTSAPPPPAEPATPPTAPVPLPATPEGSQGNRPTPPATANRLW